MISVFYSNVAQKLPVPVYNYWFAQLTPAMQQTIGSFRFWQDAQRALIGKALLVQGFEQLAISSFHLSQLQYTAFNKPFVPGSPWQFNISHSGNIVVCVFVNDLEIGIDVEEIKPIPLLDFSGLFSAMELTLIFAKPDDFKPFYTLWTQKEAFVKAVGHGLSIPLNEVIISENKVLHNNETWYLHLLPLNGQYICHIACNKPNQQTCVDKIKFV